MVVQLAPPFLFYTCGSPRWFLPLLFFLVPSPAPISPPSLILSRRETRTSMPGTWPPLWTTVPDCFFFLLVEAKSFSFSLDQGRVPSLPRGFFSTGAEKRDGSQTFSFLLPAAQLLPRIYQFPHFQYTKKTSVVTSERVQCLFLGRFKVPVSLLFILPIILVERSALTLLPSGGRFKASERFSSIFHLKWF